jgi:hypothetical protein
MHCTACGCHPHLQAAHTEWCHQQCFITMLLLLLLLPLLLLLLLLLLLG